MGFEPTTFCMASRRSSQLSYSRAAKKDRCGELELLIPNFWDGHSGLGNHHRRGSAMHRKALTALLGAVAISVLLIAPSVASAWAPADQATVHPGVQVFTQGAQCTANFVYQDGSDVYLGQAAHCSGTGGQTETNGCTSGSLPIGTPVQITGTSKPGTLVYNSWLTMQGNGE